jgi:hypothetical protein
MGRRELPNKNIQGKWGSIERIEKEGYYKISTHGTIILH